MVLVKMIAFAILNILYNLVFMQKSLKIISDVSKIRKSAGPDLTFILVVLSESVISFF